MVPTTTSNTPEPSPAERWLNGFPPETQATVASWFKYIVSAGAKEPGIIVSKVTVLIGQNLDWAVDPSSRQLCQNTLTALRCDRAGALQFAASMLATAGK
jgi:hypothetical protein